jgi:hypothetical protein
LGALSTCFYLNFCIKKYGFAAILFVNFILR